MSKKQIFDNSAKVWTYDKRSGQAVWSDNVDCAEVIQSFEDCALDHILERLLPDEYKSLIDSIDRAHKNIVNVDDVLDGTLIGKRELELKMECDSYFDGLRDKYGLSCSNEAILDYLRGQYPVKQVFNNEEVKEDEKSKSVPAEVVQAIQTDGKKSS